MSLNAALRSSLRGTGPFASMNFFIISLLDRPWNAILPMYSSYRQHPMLHRSMG